MWKKLIRIAYGYSCEMKSFKLSEYVSTNMLTILKRFLKQTKSFQFSKFLTINFYDSR